MSAPLRRREFFALEAGEYLERLSVLVSAAGRPDGEEFVRYARALRGTSQMAGPPGYDAAAAALEQLAKNTRDGTLAWTPILADRLADALEDCKALLGQIREWADPEIARCERLASSIAALAGGEVRSRPSAPGSSASTVLTAGVRAFVAREAAAVAAALDQIAESLERAPGSIGAGPVIHRLQPLRGLGALPGLSPLPEMLEALDLTLGTAGKGGGWPPDAGRALRATGAALARMARDIAELGIPQADSHEVVQAAELLRETFAGSDDVVPIAALFRAGDEEPILVRGVTPEPPQPPTDLTVELVSLADRLRMTASQSSEQAAWTTRVLNHYALTLGLRGLVMSLGLRAATGGWLLRFDREAMSGRAAADPSRSASLLAAAADALVEAAGAGEVTSLSSALAPLEAELDRMGAVEAAAPPEAPEPVPAAAAAPEPLADTDVVPIAALAPDESDVVPIQSLFFTAAEPVQPPRLSAFERSFSTYQRLIEGADAGETVESQIVPLEIVTPPPMPVATSVPAAPPPAAEPAVAGLELEIVPIDDLLYRGRRALERADQVREELDRLLKGRRDFSGVEPLLAELLDLVPLALADDR